jgi:hypothetical protein
MPRRAAYFALAIVAGLASPAMGQSIDPFVGRFEGKSTSTSGDDRTQRDLTVIIAKSDDGKGFIVEWKTVIHGRSGGEDERREKVRFIPTKRPNIYSAGSRMDMFGKLVPIDPISGDAYYWARIRDSTLTVHNILITEDGGYEMQIYHRTVKPDGTMTVEFRRNRDGNPLRTVSGDLKRVK